jgi:hypothetical protein
VCFDGEGLLRVSSYADAEFDLSLSYSGGTLFESGTDPYFHFGYSYSSAKMPSCSEWVELEFSRVDTDVEVHWLVEAEGDPVLLRIMEPS